MRCTRVPGGFICGRGSLPAPTAAVVTFETCAHQQRLTVGRTPPHALVGLVATCGECGIDRRVEEAARA